jgi:cytochrome c556
MSRRALLSAPVLLLAIVLVGAGRSARAYDDEDDKAIKAAQKDIVTLASLIEEGKEAEAQKLAAAMRKKYDDLLTIMTAYKPTKRKGLGVGPKGPADSIETKIQSMAKRPPSADVLSKQKADFLRMGYVNAAIADVTILYTPKPKGGKGKAEWERHSKDQRKASLELVEAIKSGDPKKVKTASKRLDDACTSCHSDFRSND